jgi:hypothetical protein
MRILIFILLFALKGFGWTHLELGAGNYADQYQGDPAVQFGVLFWTLDELILRNPAPGLFFVNDINADSANYAAKQLEKYAEQKGYADVRILPLVGDFRVKDFTRDLREYGPELFDSIHIKNPETLFYGRHHQKNAESSERKKTRDMLVALANQSKEGLYLFILDVPSFLPTREKEQFIDRGILYQAGDAWSSVDYWHPNGSSIQGGRVFLIPRDALLPPETSPSLP